MMANVVVVSSEPPAATPDFNGPAIVDQVLSELADQRGRLILVIDDLHKLHSPDALAQQLTVLSAYLSGHGSVINGNALS